MAWLIERGNIWTACWLDHNGKEVRKSTRVHVRPMARDKGQTAKQLKVLAQRVAEGMEGSAKSGLSLELAVAAVRAAAVGGEAVGVTIGEYSQRWLAEKRAQKSYNNNKVAVESLLRLMPNCRELPLARFTAAMGEDFVRACLDEVGGSTVDRRLEALGAMFNRAVRERLLEVNPLRGIRVPKWALNEAREREPFTREELQKMLEVLPGEWPDMVVVCLLLGGQRLSDVATLRWDKVDFERSLVRVTDDKTNKPRLKPLIKPLREVLERRRAAAEGWSDYVFPYAQLRYAQAGDKSSKLSIEFSKLLVAEGVVPAARVEDDERRAGKARRFQTKTFHSLRSTATTFLLDVGCPPELVRHIVGHDDPAIERAHYYKPSSSVQHDYMQKLAELLGLKC